MWVMTLRCRKTFVYEPALVARHHRPTNGERVEKGEFGIKRGGGPRPTSNTGRPSNNRHHQPGNPLYQ